MRLKKYLSLMCLAAFFACTDLDIAPINTFGEKEIYGNTAGVTSQIARMYSLLPMEDFRYNHEITGLFNKSNARYRHQDCLTGEAIGRDTKGADAEAISTTDYWDSPYKAIREVNIFIETLPKYSANHKPEEIKIYLGEAYFVRAFIYYSLVKRYGGIPIVDHVIDYPATVDMEGTKLYRNSEEESWDFIASDLDKAIENLAPTSQKGRANKYVAAAFKSRTMLHAGSIAKYNQAELVYHDKRVCGIPSARAKGYFQAAYDAAKLFDGVSTYGLYTAEMGTTQEGIATNFTNIFLKETKENIFVRYYLDPSSVHNFDNDVRPHQARISGGSNDSEICPTLDFVEMFDGIATNPDGTFANFDASGKYKFYNSPLDAFANCEGRLRGTVILPMAVFNNKKITIQRGLWIGSILGGVSRLPGEGDATYPTNYPGLRTLANTGDINTVVNGYKVGGEAGNGPVDGWDYGNISGFYLRKYLNPSAPSAGKVTTSWIEIRYAEVLLNLAEAAYELKLAGETTDKSGTSYTTMAFTCIDGIRQRAGAVRLANEAALSIDVIRKERRKELAFEHKTYWDLKRWRIIEKEQSTNKKWRTLNPFQCTENGQYILSIKYQSPLSGNYIYDFDERTYYQQIPSQEIKRNPNCTPNPGY